MSTIKSDTKMELFKSTEDISKNYNEDLQKYNEALDKAQTAYNYDYNQYTEAAYYCYYERPPCPNWDNYKPTIIHPGPKPSNLN